RRRSCSSINGGPSAPSVMRSSASSKSRARTACAPVRAAVSAASLARLARSAPLMPGVACASAARSTSGPSGMPRVWMRRMASLPSDSIDLVDEDDGWGRGLGLLEEVAHPAGAYAHEDLDELGGADAEEGHARLPGHGARQQRLAAAGRADQQHALGDARAQALILLGVAQE